MDWGGCAKKWEMEISQKAELFPYASATSIDIWPPKVKAHFQIKKLHINAHRNIAQPILVLRMRHRAP